MTTSGKFGWLLLLFVCCEQPAYANNPPQPDGLFSVLLIFPLIILGARLAGLSPVQKTLWKRIVTGIILAMCVLVAMAGTEIALVPLAAIFVYAIIRGRQIILLGQGRKRIWIAMVIFAWTPFAFLDYGVSLTDYEDTPARYESAAISRLRTLAIAESKYLESTKGAANSTPPIAGITELRNAHLIDTDIAPGKVVEGYLYGQIIEQNKGRYLFYAVPAYPLRTAPPWWHIVPGGTLIKAILHLKARKGTGERSFAVDETGLIRYSLVARPLPNTREEIEKWAKVY